MLNKNPVWIVYAIALILAACSLLYELLIAQTLAMLAANTVVWYSLTVGTYLGAMGLAALFHDAGSNRCAWSSLYKVEMLLSAVGAASVVVIHLAHTVDLYFQAHGLVALSGLVFFGPSFLLIALVGILTGIELPLLIRLGNEVSIDRKVTNRVLGLDYIGALVAGVTFPLVLLPHLELIAIGLVTASVNLLVAVFILGKLFSAKRPVVVRAGVTGAFGVVLLVSFLNLSSVEQYFLKKYYYYIEYPGSLVALLGPMKDRPDVFRARSPYQEIDIVYDTLGYDSDVLIDAYSSKFIEDPSQPRNRALFLNGDLQVYSSYEEHYHEFFAHVPVILNGKVPEQVLVMGGGDGLLIRELTKYGELRHITHVDLDPKLVALARTHPVLTALNDHALEDPRVHTLVGDAYQYIRNTRKVFDAIYLDFPYAKDYNLSKLYSREFFHFVREHLAEDGYAVLDAPGLEDGGRDWEVYYHTILKAGFETILPYVSNLEFNNPKAYEILDSLEMWNGDSEKTRQLRKRKLVADYVLSLRQGYILVRKDSRDTGRYSYRELGISLHVLNEQRFQRAFELPLPVWSHIDMSKVNSIMRPTLPTIKIWRTRSAW